MKADRTIQFIEGFRDNEKRVLTRGFQSLEGVSLLNDLLGHPVDQLKIIHIAGSKGKGSTAHIISSILQKAGYKVGLFTSPHIRHIRERIRVNGQVMTEDEYYRAADDARRRLEGCAEPLDRASYFDLFTMMAFLHFIACQCDYAVIETGLGGLYDSTNIVKPAASVIAPVEEEHRALLGDTLEEIARHKCGIIKKGTPVFTNNFRPAVTKLIKDTAREKGCVCLNTRDEMGDVKTDFNLDGMRLDFTYGERSYSFKSLLIGEHQADNILLAFLAVKNLLPDLDDRAIKEGVETTCLPGRFEIVSAPPPVIHEVAHTPDSVGHTLETLKRLGLSRGCLIFACCGDKEIERIARVIGHKGSGLFREIYLTGFPGPRCADLAKLETAFQAEIVDKSTIDISITVNPDAKSVYKKALSQKSDYGFILAMGSFMLLGQLGDLHLPRVPRPDQSLAVRTTGGRR